MTKYYWYGEDRSRGYRPVTGIHLYTSEDLYNWTDEGIVFRSIPVSDEEYGKNGTNLSIFTEDEYFKTLYGDYEGRLSDTPYGPFKLLGTYDLYYSEKADYEALEDHPGAVRDMNLFVDTDGTAYISYSSEMNRTTYVGKLNADYTGPGTDPDVAVEGVDYTRNFINQSREASAMFLYDGTYYTITSGCTGWYPNQAQYAVADTPLGPWTTKGDPCIGDTSGTTFDTQSTCVIPVDAEKGKYIYMGDRWYYSGVNGGELSDSRYVWLPVEFGTDKRIALRNYSDWTLEDLGAKDTLLINGGFEKGLVAWNTDSAASIGNTDAPEGLQYCVENGNGISQYIMVSPNTEYILTGTAKPGEGAHFWIGAKVDGKEIYAVLSPDSDYTDTTDNESKLAYSVVSGVTEWTDFEVKFTTGADTKTVKIYTWVSGGNGYVDNLTVREAADFTKLQEAADRVSAIDTGEYTEESVAALTKALDNANAVLADKHSSQKAVDEALNALEDAEAALEKETENPENPVQSVSFNADSANMIIGKKNQLKVIVTPADADGADEVA